MKALLLKGKETLILEEVNNPIPQKDQVLVNIEITGPNIMGHGICGTTKAGLRVAINPLLGCGLCEYCNQNLVQLCTEWKLIGVQTNGGFTQQIVVPKTTLVEIPEDISWEQSCFIEPFANSINAWEIANVNPEEKVLIIGAGGIGLGLAACAKRNKHHETYILYLIP